MQQDNFESKITFYGVITFGLIIVLASSIVIVNAGERGVALNFGKPVGTFDEGLSFKNPITISVVKMNIRTLKYETDNTAASKDLQDVKVKVALNYHLDGSKVMDLYRTIGSNVVIEQTIISPAVQESVKASTAEFNAQELITERAVVKSKIENLLKSRLDQRGIYIETLSITDFKFSPEFEKAIEAKQVAAQQTQQAQNILEKVKIEADQARSRAQGEADSTLIKAKAEAQSIEIQGEALRQNQGVTTLRAIEKWNGVLPIVNSGGSLPFILDISKVASTNSSS